MKIHKRKSIISNSGRGGSRGTKRTSVVISPSLSLPLSVSQFLEVGEGTAGQLDGEGAR